MNGTFIKESSCQNVKRIAKQGAASLGHVLTEGAGKPLALFAVVAYCGEKDSILPNRRAFGGLLAAYLVLALGGLINQFNYAGRTSVDALPAEQQIRSDTKNGKPIGFRQVYFDRVLACGDDIFDKTDYPYRKARVKLGYLLFSNTLTEVLDGIAAAFALMAPNDETALSSNRIISCVVMGGLAGLVKASQSNIVVLRRGWENYSADMAVRHDVLVPSLESIFPWIRGYNQRFANIMPIITPLMFGILHVLAVKKADFLHPLFKKISDGRFEPPFVLFACLLFMATTAGATHYDVRNAGVDLGYGHALAENYRVSGYLDKKWQALLESAHCLPAVNEANEEPSSAIATVKNWSKSVVRQPCESLSRVLYGDTLRTFFRQTPVIKKVSASAMSGVFYVGIFYLFYLALIKNNQEVIESWLGEDRTTSWNDAAWYVKPEAIFTVVSLFAAVAQTMQKYRAFKQANDRDSETDWISLGHEDEKGTYHQLPSSGGAIQSQ